MAEIMASDRFRYVILGAGCAGLSLCYYLLEAGVSEEIVLLDRRTSFPDDRTWCFWHTRSQPFHDLATHCWHAWRVYGPDGGEVRQDRTAIGYARLRSSDFYSYVLDRLSQAPNVTLRMGEYITGYTQGSAGVSVQTGQGTVTGDYLFDGRGGGPTGGLRQHFFGQVLQTSVPTFDPSCPTLMDFRVSQEQGLRFLYVLPYSPTEALVEDTCLGGPTLAPEAHRSVIAKYARRFLDIGDFKVTHEESGSIPMCARRLPLREGARVFHIGQAAGASKPSSGYTFLRIQEQCQRLAEAMTSGQPDNAPRRFAPRRFAFFDAAFLAALQQAPEQFPAYFSRLFRTVPPDALARFLSENSTWRDEFRVATALPPGPFLRAALTSAPQWLPHLMP
jgi:lycopene beta-cyclase